MYIYLDDSGVINAAGGKFYVWAGFSIKSGYKKLAELLDLVLTDIKTEQLLTHANLKEAKGNIATHEQRKKVFEVLANWDDLRICYIAVDKTLLNDSHRVFNKAWSGRHREQTENYFISKVVSRLADPIPNDKSKSIIVAIDGQPKRANESNIRLHEYLSLRVNYPKWKKEDYWNNFNIKYDQELNNSLLQAADFIASFVNEYFAYMEYTRKRDSKKIISYYELWDILNPRVYHKIIELKNTSKL